MQQKDQSLPKKITSGRLGKKFAILIILFSSCFTLLSTSLQLGLDYRADMSRIEQQFQNIQTSYLQAITLSVWSLDDSQIETQLVGLSQLPDIEYVSIIVDGEINWEVGEARSAANRTVDLPLDYTAPGISSQNIGSLRVTASIDNVYQRLINKAGVILISNGIKTFLVSGFILLLVWFYFNRHLKTISDYLKDIDLTRTVEPLQLKKKTAPAKEDEIDNVANTINQMCRSLHKSYEELNQNKLHLQELVKERDSLLVSEREHKEHLEEKVTERTQQLQDSMNNLRSAQDLLVETEKMAALGNMVAGVAHEINTPIGVCRTAASFQADHSKIIRDKLKSSTLTQSDLNDFLDGVDESSTLFETNIVKASKLISSFKQIATDQSYDACQHFTFDEYLESSIQTILPQYKHSNIHFSIDVEPDIEMESYPGAYHQILSNLINNTTLHGFDKETGGTISITGRRENGDLILDYRDDGRGLSSEEAKKLFEPFFTTKRGKGGSGLGMSIVYNIVARQLEGRISLQDSDKGIHVRIQTPLIVKKAIPDE